MLQARGGGPIGHMIQTASFDSAARHWQTDCMALPPPHPAVQRMAQSMALADRSLFEVGEVMTQLVIMAPERVFRIETP